MGTEYELVSRFILGWYFIAKLMFVLLLFGKFKCCLQPYSSHYSSPLSSTAREFGKNRI